MPITNIDLSAYNRYSAGSTLSAAQFNALVTALQTKVNELVSSANAGGSSETEHKFYVNGVETSPTGGIVRLASKGKYVLSGTLSGRVVIGTATDTWADNESSPTQVILDGCTIITDSTDNAALEYVPEQDKLIVTLAQNTINHLVCTHDAAQADSQKGALHSENDLIVQGSAYLSCINKGGHGIKASELRMAGNPHIYVEAVHDGIHGNKMLLVECGYYYINGANDAFGTRAESGTPGTATYKSPGSIWLFGGVYHAYNIKQKVFDSKAPGYIFCQEQVKNTETAAANNEVTGIFLRTDCAASDIYAGIIPVDPEIYFGSPVVEGATLEGNVYTATGTDVTVKGYFSGYRFVFPVKSTNLTLNGAYIRVIGNDAIDYTVDSKNIKVTVAKDTANIIKAPVAINSANNIAIEAKNFGALYIEGSVKGSEISFRDSFGTVMVDGDITGSQILLGEAGKTPFGGSLHAEYLIARLSSKNAKGNIIVSADDLIGCVTVDELRASGTSTFADTYHVNYRRVAGSTFIGDRGSTIEPYIVVPYNSQPIPSIR